MCSAIWRVEAESWTRFYHSLSITLSPSLISLSLSAYLLRQIREYHAHHPAARALEPMDDPEVLIKEEPHVEFSGEVSLAVDTGFRFSFGFRFTFRYLK